VGNRTLRREGESVATGSETNIRFILVWETTEKASVLKMGRTKFDSGDVTLSADYFPEGGGILDSPC
jgi:hypothetical protein